MQVVNGKIEVGIEDVVSVNLFLSNQTTGVSEMTTNNLPPNPKSIKICSVEGCGSSHYVQAGFCNKHYLRWRRHGDVNFSTSNFGDGKTVEERFWSRVKKNANEKGCWEWTAGKQTNGYAKVTDENGMRVLVHRFSWLLTFGYLPTLFLLHSCDNRICVNPDHLREGTQQENVQDMIDRGRDVKGQDKKNAKLSDDDVLEIRRLLKTSIYQKDIAKIFGVHKSRISDIVAGRNWKHVQLLESDCR